MSREQALAYMGEEGKIRERKDEIIWKRNGERWIWKPWSEGYRVYRFYKIVVSKDFDEDLFRHLIYPCCVFIVAVWKLFEIEITFKMKVVI